jgi:integrase
MKKERFLSGEEIGRLFSTLSDMELERSLRPEFANALRLLAMTGARKNEILRLSWSEVDLDRGLINLPARRSKTGAKAIVLNAPALSILSGLTRMGDVVFPSPSDPDKPIEGLQSAFERIRARACLEDVRIHDLRHTFASLAIERGASLFLVSKALGHSQIATTQRYAHVGDDPLRSVAEDVGRAILEAGAGTSANVTSLRSR